MEFFLIAEEEQLDEISTNKNIKYEVTHSNGEKVFSDEVCDDLLCPSQVYEYVELVDVDMGTVRYVGYDEKDTYESNEKDEIVDMLFKNKGEKTEVEQEEVSFDEQRSAKIFI